VEHLVIDAVLKAVYKAIIAEIQILSADPLISQTADVTAGVRRDVNMVGICDGKQVGCHQFVWIVPESLRRTHLM
jgi:hypothetical protein